MVRYDWESEELFQLRKIKSKLIDIIRKPNISNDDLTKLFFMMSDEESRLIKRDSYINNDKVCSHCQSDNIYICEPCMNVWSKELDDKLKVTNDTINNR
tara:strand:- start:352 stop:648 length:297 start_codon:yes stop_codon:yes gene_type:complete